jgi:hypothetical protein
MFFFVFSNYSRNRTSGRHHLGVFYLLLLGTMLVFAGCGRPSNATQKFQAARPGIAPPQLTPTPDPFDWVWQMRIPEDRLVVYYRIFDDKQKIQYPGFKLFYPNFPGASPHPTLDEPFMTPADVLKLNPPPVMVMYQ